jgi:hypothetical protein
MYPSVTNVFGFVEGVVSLLFLTLLAYLEQAIGSSALQVPDGIEQGTRIPKLLILTTFNLKNESYPQYVYSTLGRDK